MKGPDHRIKLVDQRVVAPTGMPSPQRKTTIETSDIDSTPAARYEIKMICREDAYPAVITCIVNQQIPVHRLYPSRVVQSVYLDTYEGRALQDNLSGMSDRSKLRFRWYGSDRKSVRGGYLERKTRRNTLGWKKRYALDSSLSVEGIPRPRFVSHLRALCPPVWQAQLDIAATPVQWISYHRDYYSTMDGVVRITIDRHLRMCEQRQRYTLSAKYPKPVPDVLVVECKAAEVHYDELQALLSGMPLVIDKCSKFALASNPRLGPIISEL